MLNLGIQKLEKRFFRNHEIETFFGLAVLRPIK